MLTIYSVQIWNNCCAMFCLIAIDKKFNKTYVYPRVMLD